MKDFGNPRNIDVDRLAANLQKLVEIHRHDSHTCTTCQTTETEHGWWKCINPRSGTERTLCFTCACQVERCGWIVELIPTYAQKREAEQWAAAGIGAN